MLKKAIPLVLISGLVLGACNNNGNNGGAVPKNNETPMEDHNNMEPRVNDGQTGPNMDGLDNDRNGNGNNGNTGNGGIINDTNHNGVINDGNTTTPRDEVIIEENVPNDVIIDENTNRDNKNGNNR